MIEKKEIRVPKQERGIETRNKILEAGKKLFSEKGFYKTNSKQIAKEAGVATGTFYIYFKDKKPLFLEIFTIYYEQIMNDILNLPIAELSSPEEAKQMIDLFIDKLFLAHDINPQFHREIISMVYSDEEVRLLNEQLEKKAMAFITQFLEANQAMLRVSNLEAATFIVFKSSEEVIHYLKIFRPEFDDVNNRILNELKDLIYHYLF